MELKMRFFIFLTSFLGCAFVTQLSFASNGAIENHSGERMAQFKIPTNSEIITLNESHIDQLIASVSTVGHLEGFRLVAENSIFNTTHFMDVDLTAADLRNSLWSQNIFDTLDMREADLMGSQFSGNQIYNCNFDRADIRGAKFLDVGFTSCSFSAAIYDNNTQLPFDPGSMPGMGMIYAP